MLVGWLASTEKISTIELTDDLNNKYMVEYGGERKDVQGLLKDAYYDSGRSGFTVKLGKVRSFSGKFSITLSSGKKFQSKEFLLRFYDDDASYLHANVPFSKEMGHQTWRRNLAQIANENKMKVLEIGSRNVVTKRSFKHLLTDAEYTGFDYYDGPNVDVVGDAHKLSSYFNEQFDLIFSAAVFEHLAMPWVVAEEITKLLKINGLVFVETHYCYGSHERPWHFFQFSEVALKALFSPALGYECIEAGVSNPMVGRFSLLAAEYLRDKRIHGLYCHSAYFGKKVKDVKNFKWNSVDLSQVVNETEYPAPTAQKS